MKWSTRRIEIIAAVSVIAIVSTAVLIHPIPSALSQQSPLMGPAMHDHDQMPGMMQMNGQGTGGMGMTTPVLPGQDAFGAVQEIVRMLEADPETDWSNVNLEALRQHLIDMNEVTLKADAPAKPVDGGLEIAITGDGRTLAAIQRMLPAHAQELNQLNGWSAKTRPLKNGVLLTVTSRDPQQVIKIRGLGFIGLLVSGSHHQAHHLAMAKNEMPNQH